MSKPKYQKLRITHKIKTTAIELDSETPIVNVISSLQNLLDQIPPGVQKDQAVLVSERQYGYYDDTWYDWRLEYYTWETDQDFEARVAKLEQQEKDRKKRQRIMKEQNDRATYQILHAKYGVKDVKV